MNWIGRRSVTELEVSLNWIKYLIGIFEKCLFNFIQFSDTSSSVTLRLPIQFIDTSSTFTALVILYNLTST